MIFSQQQQQLRKRDPKKYTHSHLGSSKLLLSTWIYYTVKCFKVWSLVTKIQFHIKKSRFSVKSQFKEPKCVDWGHLLNRDFTVVDSA